jgi:hypothetical protein
VEPFKFIVDTFVVGMVWGTPISRESRGHIYDMDVRRGIPANEIFGYLF